MDKAHGQGRFEHVDGDAGGLKDTTFRAVKRCHKFISCEWRKWRKKSDKPIRTNQETKPGTFNCRAEKTLIFAHGKNIEVYEGHWQADKAHGQGMLGASVLDF